ncbi:YbbM seven transmembrane helix protein [Cutibacterium acnes JCM 18909]|nr:YbbM seven transmembrane helix protein [Cutibacterium acnes JCM 18909]
MVTPWPAVVFFADLREGIGIFEAGLAVGFPRRDAIALVTEPSVTESVLPTVDRTATVGLVTLPGAFVGVLLGGGSALQAGAAQASFSSAFWLVRR